MCVCIYIYIYIYVYCIYVYVYVYICICKCLRICVYMYRFIYLCVYTCVYIYIYTHVYIEISSWSWSSVVRSAIWPVRTSFAFSLELMKSVSSSMSVFSCLMAAFSSLTCCCSSYVKHMFLLQFDLYLLSVVFNYKMHYCLNMLCYVNVVFVDYILILFAGLLFVCKFIIGVRSIIQVCVYVYTCIYIYIYILYMYMYMYMYSYSYIYIYTYIYVYMYASMYIHICTYSIGCLAP